MVILDSPYVYLTQGPLVGPQAKSSSKTTCGNILKGKYLLRLNLRGQLFNNICAEYYNHIGEN